MSAYDLILILFVAAGAFYAGYQVGRLKALSERAPGSRDAAPREDAGSRDDDNPLPGPEFDRPAGAPSRPRGAPPPASSGTNDSGSWSQANAGPAPTRRSAKPPPAAAGLMDKGSSDK